MLLALGVDRLGAGARPILRMVYLYPLSVSLLVTGLIWQWVLNPGLGLERTVRALGWSGFRFDALVREPSALYAVVGAGAWHIAGLVMALFLAGLRGVDPDIWQATRIEGIPVWRAYLHVVLPMRTARHLRPAGHDLRCALRRLARDEPRAWPHHTRWRHGRGGGGRAALAAR